MVGEQIGQYRVLDRIGDGGMGTVYRAIDETLEREVALKILAPVVEDGQKRFRAEAVALARLSHPGVATVYELFQDEDRWVMVMELVRGQTFQQLVEQMGVLSPQRAAEYCMQALKTLAHAHSAGVVHRDLKPSNLMITQTGGVKILDFGIARLDGSLHLTAAGYMMGTPAYMAPEQIQGLEIDARADLYAMGVVFYRLISAQFPFQGETPLAMALSQLHDSPTPIDLMRSDLPGWVHRIVGRALAKAPAERFQSAVEFHDAFARSLAGLPLAPIGATTEAMSRPTGGWFPDQPTTSPRPWSTGARRAPRGKEVSPRPASVAITTACICLGVLGVSMGWQWLPSSPQETAPAQARREDSVLAADILLEPAIVADRRGEPTAAPKDTPGRSTTAPVTFSRVKLLIVNGDQTVERDVLITLANERLLAQLEGGGAPLASLPYRRIAKATYVRARDPQWDALLGSPPKSFNVPGILSRSRHWLVVQTTDTYAILRLDGDMWMEILGAFEAHTGVTIDRAGDG